MTRSWFEDLSALEMVPDPGPDGPGPLPRLDLAVGRWSTAPSGARWTTGAARVVDPGGAAPATGTDDEAGSWVADAFPLVRAPGPAPGFSMLEVVLTASSDDPAGAPAPAGEEQA